MTSNIIECQVVWVQALKRFIPVAVDMHTCSSVHHICVYIKAVTIAISVCTVACATTE